MTTDKTPPALTDLIGLDPDFTGGLSPEEYLRRQRCGKCDETASALAAVTADRDSYREMYGKLDAATVRVEQERDAAREQAEQARDARDEAVELLRAVWEGVVNSGHRERINRLLAGAA